MKKKEQVCFAELGSVSLAMRAEEALAKAAIPSHVLKSEASSSRRGCVWGIRFSCEQTNNVRRVLEASRISVKRWNVED